MMMLMIMSMMTSSGNVVEDLNDDRMIMSMVSLMVTSGCNVHEDLNDDADDNVNDDIKWQCG